MVFVVVPPKASHAPVPGLSGPCLMFQISTLGTVLLLRSSPVTVAVRLDSPVLLAGIY